jgi:hypothetical protein
MQKFFNMTGPDASQIATLEEIAGDGADGKRASANYE